MLTILDEKIKIHDRNIHIKVMSPSASVENKPFLFCIQGGPGFSFLTVELAAAELERQAKKANLDMPNVIFYEPVGCGSSDKAEDVAAEYTMENFTEIAAKVVEAVKAKLIPNQTMDLRLIGGSFGAMTVMDIPVHRPDWLEENSEIRLRQIIANVGPNGADTKDHARKFLDENFANHPEYQQMRTALYKLLDGKIEDQADYLRFVFNLAPLYSDALAKFKNGPIGKLLVKYPQTMISFLQSVNVVLKNEMVSFMLEGLTGCSLDVLNHFFGSDFGGFNMTAQVAQNKELYSKTSICMIASSRDHMVNIEPSLKINNMLGDTSAAIILKDKHQVNRGPNKDVFMKILLGLICGGRIPENMLMQSLIDQDRLVVSEAFQRSLGELQQPIRKRDSTAIVLSAMPQQGDEETVSFLEQPDDIEMDVLNVYEQLPTHDQDERRSSLRGVAP